MQRSSSGPLAVLAFGLAVLVAGCSSGQPQPSSKADPAAGTELSRSTPDQTGDALAELDPADRDAAKRQAACRVSDEKLGSMGAPFKISAARNEVFLCCEGCNEDFQTDPQKFFAKLKP